MARTLELDTIQTPSANNANIQLGSDTVTFSSNIAVDINNATIDGATIAQSNITVGPGKTLTVTDGTFTTSATQKKAIIEGAGADVDLGAHEVRAQTFQSDVATGTAPLTVASTTKVANLNASTLDGATKTDLFNLDHASVSGVLDVNHGGTNTSTTDANKVFAGPTSGSAAAPSFRALDRADLPTYQGATSSAVGIKGAVPAAGTGERDQFLKGDGTYATPTDTNTVTSVGTSSSNRTSGNIDITGGTNVSTSKSGSTITIASTDTNTVTSVGTSSSNRTSGNIDIVGGTNVTTSKSGGTITINSSSVPAGTIIYKFRQVWNYGAFSSSPRTYFPANSTGSFKYYNVTDSIDLLPSGSSEIQHIHFHMVGEIENNGGENPKCKFYIYSGDASITGSVTAQSSLSNVKGGGNAGVYNSNIGTTFQMQASRSSTDNKFTFHMSGTYRHLTTSGSYGGRYFYVVAAMASGNQVFINSDDTHITVYTETT